MEIISLRRSPAKLELFMDFFPRHWGMRTVSRLYDGVSDLRFSAAAMVSACQ